MAEHLVIRTRADSPELWKAASAIEAAAWSELGFLNYTRAHYAFYADLLAQFPEYQLCLVDERLGYPVAAANCVPLACDGPDALPPEGWDWVVETAAAGGSKPRNTLGALAISVPSVHRAKGYARRMIHALLMLAAEKKLRGVVAPVRPSAKADHPFVSIEDYVTWSDGAGRAYDPWLRSHFAAGGKLVGPCARSMVINEKLGFWETWTKRRFEESGRYALEGGLTPVEIDVEQQTGLYEEPNVWVTYAV
jgi:GNAT superfamily N-acetyltransferase